MYDFPEGVVVSSFSRVGCFVEDDVFDQVFRDVFQKCVYGQVVVFAAAGPFCFHFPEKDFVDLCFEFFL